jgi:four helix bundle protein
MARAINSYRDLVVWNEAMNLAEAAYRVSAQLPRDEAYGLCSQIRRSAGSVPANIAEGYGRDSKGAYVQQLRVAQGSLKELETHILLAERVGLIGTSAIAPLLDTAERFGKTLRALIRAVEAST